MRGPFERNGILTAPGLRIQLKRGFRPLRYCCGPHTSDNRAFRRARYHTEREISLTQSGARTPLDVVRKSPRCRGIQSLDVVRFWHSMSS